MGRGLGEADTIERILREAGRLFVAKGYEGVSMREIGEAVGITKAALYYHFQDKEDLFMAILNTSLEEISAVLEAAELSERGVRGQIEATVRGLLGLPAERRALIRVASQEIVHVSPEMRTGFNAVYQQKFVGRIVAMLAEGMERGEARRMDAQLAAWLLLGMAYPFFQPAYSPREMDAIAGILVSVFFEGLGTQ